MADDKGDEYLNQIVANPKCITEDKALWNFSKLKQAYEKVPEKIKKNNPAFKKTPKILRQWFTENAGLLDLAPVGGGGAAGKQQQQQQINGGGEGCVQPENLSCQVGYNNTWNMEGPGEGRMPMGVMQMGPDMGMMPGMEMGYGDMGTGIGMGMDPTGYQDNATMVNIPRQRFMQIRERFNERDLELKQAHLQIQLMQLQLEKLEAENRLLKNMNGVHLRRNTEILFNL